MMTDVRNTAHWEEQLKAGKPGELLVVEWVSPTCKVRSSRGQSRPRLEGGLATLAPISHPPAGACGGMPEHSILYFFCGSLGAPPRIIR